MTVSACQSMLTQCPTGVTRAVDPDGILFSRSETKNRGTRAGVDGKGRAAKFFNIAAMTCDAAGNLWVSDGSNHAIRKVTPDGAVTTIAGLGMAGNTDGDSTKAMFNYPCGITIDNAGTVFVADKSNCRIRKLEYK